MKNNLVLRPFSEGSHPFTVTFRAARTKDRLSLEYRIAGSLESLAVPPPKGQPEFRERLWETTCFEAFVGLASATSYWEHNFSPSGDWWCAFFEDYRRQGNAFVRHKPAIAVETSPGAIEAWIDVPLPAELAAAPLRLAPAVITRFTNDGQEFWATAHREDKPDFHGPHGFTIHL